jgi:MarR family transcriptional regulator, transcriptional regulator for hemolysin
MSPASDLRAGFAPLLSLIAREWRRAVDRRLEPFGLTEATWLPLLRIARSAAPMRQNELAASLSLDNSSVVRLLDSLEKAGLVERREDFSDRRAKSLALTLAGRRTVAQVEAVSQEVRGAALGHLSDEEIARAFQTLTSVREKLADLLEPVAA